MASFWEESEHDQISLFQKRLDQAFSCDGCQNRNLWVKVKLSITFTVGPVMLNCTAFARCQVSWSIRTTALTCSMARGTRCSQKWSKIFVMMMMCCAASFFVTTTLDSSSRERRWWRASSTYSTYCSVPVLYCSSDYCTVQYTDCREKK